MKNTTLGTRTAHSRTHADRQTDRLTDGDTDTLTGRTDSAAANCQPHSDKLPQSAVVPSNTCGVVPLNRRKFVYGFVQNKT